MCTARTKLREVEMEMDATYSELREMRKQLVQARQEKEVAEQDTKYTHQRNMCLTRNADFSNFLAMALAAAFVIVCGILAYVL